MRILLIEDDEQLCFSTAYQLKNHGFLVDTCMDGEDALSYFKQNIYDLILLDRMLPHIDGITLLKRLREKNNTTPVIILTALGELDDKIIGLDAGADDYMVKPFAIEELLARIRSINRRPRQWKETDVLTYHNLTYSPTTNVLKGPLGTCTLSNKEGALMEFFLHNSTQILPRETLLTKVWGPYADIEDGNLDNYIHFIRRRLKSVSTTITIKTLRGIGYQLEALE
ncbi:response regulator transcription factor [Anaerosporobacter faecicola]|uniref:response regulator transcription factor n=1 Tax=Anaerosporobacter faecicola TaxID=2718714 RepID=UPI00143B2DCC|nr:response regulator transcription factor [Anaerosporobacter faecicola]